MSRQRPCQSQNPTTCKYHGVTSTRYTEQLRQELVEATNQYNKQLAETGAYDPATFGRYTLLRNAQINYYATEAGQTYLYECLEKGVGDPTEVKRLLKESIEHRVRAEQTDKSSQWSEAAAKARKGLRPTAFPISLEPSVNGIRTISNVEDKLTGDTTSFRWEEETGTVYIEVVDKDGNSDLDEMRTIGSSKSFDQAVFTAYTFFRDRMA